MSEELKKSIIFVENAPLAQLVVAVVLHTTGHRFDPCRVYNKKGTESRLDTAAKL
jgi:hypothetical protein